MKIKLTLITWLAFLFSGLAYADCGSFSSADLLKTCQVGMNMANDSKFKMTPNDVYNSGTCLGYVKGFIYLEAVYSAIVVIKTKHHASEADARKIAQFCMPINVENKAYVQVFLDYMNKHPEEANTPACISVLNAFSQAYPCH